MRYLCRLIVNKLTIARSMATAPSTTTPTCVPKQLESSSFVGQTSIEASDDWGKALSVKLDTVIGHNNKTNDILFSGNLVRGKGHVIYFGGDVQDFRDNMLGHRDNQRYAHWSLEDTSTILGKRFPDSNIWVVRPACMYLKTMSVFANFVESCVIGIPTFSENYGALLHLEALLANAISRVNLELDSLTEKTASAVDNNREKVCESLPITLIGFSKGCVVLNQILHELPLAKTDDTAAAFVSRIKSFYWLDGGHAGHLNTWITDKVVLKNLCQLSAELFVHVTPYQLEDTNKPWVAKDEKKFVSRLKELGLKVKETKHFEDKPRSIETHFQILTVF